MQVYVTENMHLNFLRRTQEFEEHRPLARPSVVGGDSYSAGVPSKLFY